MEHALDVSVVVIGRNEGERLLRCLDSIKAAKWGAMRHEIWYVDSRSTDASVERAAQAGAHTLVVQDGAPCAAKARNLGWQAAKGEFILFLDGDTQLHPEFVSKAITHLKDPVLCAVWGHRRESHPEQSVYTRVLDLDWIYPAGITPYFGGDVLVRRAALQSVNGFDPTLNAGEEPEMCARLRAKGWKILHIDSPMTQHDLAVKTLRAYALRCYRSGIAYAEVTHRMDQLGDPLWQREAKRDYLHGLLYVLAPLLLGLGFYMGLGIGLALLVLGALVVLRSALRCMGKADGHVGLALQYAVHSHLQKIPAFMGQLAWRRAHQRKHKLALVDYKE